MSLPDKNTVVQNNSILQSMSPSKYLKIVSNIAGKLNIFNIAFIIDGIWFLFMIKCRREENRINIKFRNYMNIPEILGKLFLYCIMNKLTHQLYYTKECIIGLVNKAYRPYHAYHIM